MWDKDFNIWWSGCWLKVGKLAAKAAYERARRIHGVTAEQLLIGREAYMQHKPDWQQWVHPRTWLQQGRWMDEWAPQSLTSEYWADECQRLHHGGCLKQWDHEMLKHRQH